MPTIKTTLVAEGEKVFRQQIEEISGTLRVLGSELKKTEAEFKTNGTTAETLAKRDEVLNKTLGEQSKKVETLRVELEKVTAQYGEHDKRTLRLTDQLYKAETAVLETKSALQENAKAMDQSAKSTETLDKKTSTLGDGIGKLTEAFGVRLPGGLSKYISGIDSASARTALFTTAAIKLVSTLVKASMETSKSADEILRLSSTTGMSTDQIQTLQYASEFLDVSFETMSSAQTKMIRNMNSAREGTGDAAEAYKKLGIKVTDSSGQLRDANDVFGEALDKLKGISNETERDALAMSIFGKSARELNPLIEAGSAALDEWAQKAKDAGIVMDESTLKKYEQLDDAFKMFEKSQVALTQTLGTVLLPVLTAVFEFISKIPPDVIKVVVVIAAVVAGIVAVVSIIKSVNQAVGVVKSLTDVANAKMLKTTAIILGIVAALIILGITIAVIKGQINDLKQAYSSASTSMGGIAKTPHYANGTSYHPGGWATVGENGEEDVWLPRGSVVIPHRETMSLRKSIPAYAGGVGSFGNIFHISIEARNVREFNDIVTIAQNQRMSTRKGYTGR